MLLSHLLSYDLFQAMQMNSSKPGVAEVNEPDLERRYDSAELVAVLNRHVSCMMGYLPASLIDFLLHALFTTKCACSMMG